jgi:hypothetical protein
MHTKVQFGGHATGYVISTCCNLSGTGIPFLEDELRFLEVT